MRISSVGPGWGNFFDHCSCPSLYPWETSFPLSIIFLGLTDKVEGQALLSGSFFVHVWLIEAWWLQVSNSYRCVASWENNTSIFWFSIELFVMYTLSSALLSHHSLHFFKSFSFSVKARWASWCFGRMLPLQGWWAHSPLYLTPGRGSFPLAAKSPCSESLPYSPAF